MPTKQTGNGSADKTQKSGGAAPAPNPEPDFITAGNPTSKINVQISYRIIELFSQGLYRSANKAIEELVSNSFDAGATKVHVAISSDLVAGHF